MKRKNLIFVMLLVLSALLTIQSCKKESPVGFTEEQAFTIPTLVAPTQGFVDLTGTTVDLKWESTNAAGAPNNWAVYFGTGDDPALLQTGVTTETVTVPVVLGKKYNWKVIATDANGKTTSSPIWSFETVDPAATLDVSMAWTTDIKTVIGVDLAPDKAVNLRMLIYKSDKVTLAVPVINTASFEDFPNFSTLADGVYFIATDIASTVNAGDLNQAFDISINLTFKQRGILSQVIPFTNVMTNANPCPLFRTYLVKVTKAGNTFTVDQAVSDVTPPIITWNGTDGGSASQVTTLATCASPTMTGLGFGWMLDYWGEVIISGGTLNYTISGNTITIPLQAYCKTTYLGAAQTPYFIQGTGTINNSGAFPVWTIHYDFKQGNHFIVADPLDGWPTPYLEAVITTNPAKSLMHIVMPAKHVR
jgi:hypothetical protein